MKDIPVLWNHDHTKQPLGRLHVVDGRLFCEFTGDMKITDAALFEIFGGAGIRVTEAEMIDGVRVIKKGEIFEFSLSGPDGVFAMARPET